MNENTIEYMRTHGCAVVIFTSEELQGANPHQVEDRLTEVGWDVIDFFREGEE